METGNNKRQCLPSLAIVIPVWNARAHIGRLLESLLAQSYRNVLIICVLDCPTDGSDDVVLSYASQNARVIPIKNECNIGIAGSRNRGIEYAIQKKVDYLSFADHDDYVEVDSYSQMVRILEDTDADVVFANTVIEFPDHNELVRFGAPTRDGVLNSLFLPMSSKRNENYLSRSVWNSVYRLGLINRESIRFRDRRVFFEEDTLFNVDVYSRTNNVQYYDNTLYHWVQHQYSTSSVSESHEEWVRKITSYFEYEKTILLSNPSLSEFLPSIQVNISWFLHRYYSVIQSMDKTIKRRIGSLLSFYCFPLSGRYENLKLISRARVRLMFFVFYMKYLQRGE